MIRIHATNSSFWFRSITEMKLLKFTSISGFDAPLLVFKTIGWTFSFVEWLHW